MSYKPSISIYADDELLDVGFYPYWSGRDIFLEAMAKAAIYFDCRDRQMFFQRKYGKIERINELLEHVKSDMDSALLEEMEACSDRRIIIDLTNQWIYSSDDFFDKRTLMELPIRCLRINMSDDEMDYWSWLDIFKDCRISYRDMDMELARRSLVDWSDASEHLSMDTMAQIERLR